MTPEKTEEEKAKLSWYRKVYEDRLGKHLPSKRLGDSIEARREAYAYSRHFTAELNHREEELNRALTKALKVGLDARLVACFVRSSNTERSNVRSYATSKPADYGT